MSWAGRTDVCDSGTERENGGLSQCQATICAQRCLGDLMRGLCPRVEPWDSPIPSHQQESSKPTLLYGKHDPVKVGCSTHTVQAPQPVSAGWGTGVVCLLGHFLMFAYVCVVCGDLTMECVSVSDLMHMCISMCICVLSS